MRKGGRENTNTHTHTHFSLLHAFFRAKMATTILTKIDAGRRGENIIHWERDAQGSQASF